MRSPALMWPAALGVVAFGVQASAHPLLFEVDELLLNDSEPTHLVGFSNAYGLVESTDCGATWEVTFGSAFGGEFNDSGTPRGRARSADGRLWVANGFNGLWTRDGATCDTWRSVPSFDGLAVANVMADASDVWVLTATGQDTDAGPRVDTRVFRRADAATGFAEVAAFPDEVQTQAAGGTLVGSGAHIVIAGRSLHLAGGGALDDSAVVFVTDDAGATWKSATITPGAADAGLTAQPRLHLLRDDGLVALTVHREGLDYRGGPDELWLSTDFGHDFQRVLTTEGILSAVALSPDGLELAVAALDGLWVGTLGDVIASGETAFELRWPYRTHGLAWTPDALYAGLEWLLEKNSDVPRGVGLGTSFDGGRTFSPVMNVCDIATTPCDAPADIDDFVLSFEPLCSTQAGFERAGACGALPAAPPGPDYGSAAVDAGTTTDVETTTNAGSTTDAGEPVPSGPKAQPVSDDSKKAGCSCSTPRRESPVGLGLLAIGAVAVALMRRTGR